MLANATIHTPTRYGGVHTKLSRLHTPRRQNHYFYIQKTRKKETSETIRLRNVTGVFVTNSVHFIVRAGFEKKRLQFRQTQV